jgi:hypothetical protein
MGRGGRSYWQGECMALTLQFISSWMHRTIFESRRSPRDVLLGRAGCRLGHWLPCSLPSLPIHSPQALNTTVVQKWTFDPITSLVLTLEEFTEASLKASILERD